MNTNSALTSSLTENPFWYQQFDLRQIRILRGGQSFVDFDTAYNNLTSDKLEYSEEDNHL